MAQRRGHWRSDSGPHAYTIGTLSTELLPWPAASSQLAFADATVLLRKVLFHWQPHGSEGEEPGDAHFSFSEIVSRGIPGAH